MADVAREAGVHQSTVSRALKNDHRLPELTRKRILEVVERLGYRPNPLVSALIAERRRSHPSGYGATIAFLTSGSSRRLWRESSVRYAVSYTAIQEHLQKRGYSLEEFWLEEPGMSPDRLKQILQHRGIHGAIVSPLPGGLHTVNFDFSGVAAVALGYTLQSPVLDHVAVDYYHMMKRIVSLLLERKFRSIGFITTKRTSDRVSHLSMGAFLTERYQFPKVLLQPLTVETETDPAPVLKWFQKYRPEVLITPTQGEYDRIHDWLTGEGIKVPQQVSMVCGDCHQNTTQSGIVQDLDAEAEAAVEWVTSRVERAIFGVPVRPRTVLVGGVWREGNSLRNVD